VLMINSNGTKDEQRERERERETHVVSSAGLEINELINGHPVEIARGWTASNKKSQLESAGSLVDARR